MTDYPEEYLDVAAKEASNKGLSRGAKFATDRMYKEGPQGKTFQSDMSVMLHGYKELAKRRNKVLPRKSMSK